MNTDRLSALLSQFYASFLLFLSLPAWGITPGFDSSPAPNADILVGEAVIAHPVTTSISVVEVGDSVLQLSALSSSVFSGAHAGDFQLLTPLPVHIEDAAPAQALLVQCTPQTAGTRTAKLTIGTNDPNQPEVFYNLSCQGLADVAGYQSQPEARRGLLITTDALGVAGTAGIRLFETGTQDLSIYADGTSIEGANAGDFSLLTPLPLTIPDGGASQTLVVQCRPTSEGLRTAVLKVHTNVPEAPYLIYPLGCIGDYSANAAFASFPAIGTRIDFTQTLPGKPSRAWLSVVNQGLLSNIVSSTDLLKVANVQVSNTSDFTLQLLDSTATPLTYSADQLMQFQTPVLLAAKAAPRQIAITCVPTGVGTRTATLTLKTSDPNHSVVSYALTCPSSDQVPPSDIMLSNTTVQEGDPANTLIGTLTTLDADAGDTHTYRIVEDTRALVRLSGNSLVLAQTANFSPDAYSIKISTTDSSGYVFEKVFFINVLSNAKFSTEVFSEAQNRLVDSVDTSETFILTATIEPKPAHVGLNAALKVTYTYTDPNNRRITLAPISLGTDTLAASKSIPLYKGNLLFLSGKMEIALSYTLASGETHTGLTKPLTIKPNTAPTDILLDAGKIPENSPAGSLVGRLNSLDANHGDSFTYALVSNPGPLQGYLAIVGNELRIADNFPVDFEDTPFLNFTLRSIDASGAFFDKTFTLETTNQIEAKFFGELRSAGTLLPNSPNSVPTVRGDYPLTLTARILPEPSHVGKQADIYYHFSFADVFADNSQPNVVIEDLLGSNVSLTELMDYPVLSNALTELSGTVRIRVGYRLLDGDNFDDSAVIAAFTVEAKSALQENTAKLAQPICDSDYKLPAILDLSVLAANFDQAFLQQINAIPLLSEIGTVAQQDASNHALVVALDGQHLAWWPLLLRVDDNVTQASVAISTRQTLKLLTADQLEIIAQPAVHNLCALQTALSQQAFSNLQVRNNGDIHVDMDASHFISMRPDVFLSDTSVNSPDFYRPDNSSALLVLADAAGNLKQQIFYAAPAWLEHLTANVDNLVFATPSLLSFTWQRKNYQGIPDLRVERGAANTATALQIEDLNDINGDGVADFKVLYHNGDQQVFYGVRI